MHLFGDFPRGVIVPNIDFCKRFRVVYPHVAISSPNDRLEIFVDFFEFSVSLFLDVFLRGLSLFGRSQTTVYNIHRLLKLVFID